MNAKDNKQQAQPQPGPIAQQLSKIQTNGQQRPSNGQQPSTKRSQKKTSDWTGFSGKTLWEWLPLLIQLLAALAIPVAIAIGTTWFSYQQTEANNQIAHDQQQETILKTYLDDMTDLLLNGHLRASTQGDEVRLVARERVLTTLRQLDAKHNRFAIQFLQDAGLIGKDSPIIDLNSGDMRGDNLNNVNLIFTSLRDVTFLNANLNNTFLAGSDLSGANLSGADLRNASLICININFKQNCVDLRGANLSGAKLQEADLLGADLSYANLYGAVVDINILREEAKSLKGATMPEAQYIPKDNAPLSDTSNRGELGLLWHGRAIPLEFESPEVSQIA